MVEDPWYVGQAAFDRTVKDMERAVPGILERVRELLAER